MSSFSRTKESIRLAAVTVSASAILLALTGCQPSSAQTTSPQAEVSASPAEPPARIAAVKPQNKTLERRSNQPGEIMAFEETPIYAKVAGYVQSVDVDIGDSVKQGQTLAVLAVPELVEELKQKSALVLQAAAQIVQAKAA